jgi:two-component system sensor histidine kinase/response regulator
MHLTTYGTDNEKGSGLGIQLCKEFISLTQENYGLKATGKGSSFFISLPFFEK